MPGGSGDLPREGARETRGSLLARRQLWPPSKTPNFLATLWAVVDELLTPQVSTVLNVLTLPNAREQWEWSCSRRDTGQETMHRQTLCLQQQGTDCQLQSDTIPS